MVEPPARDELPDTFVAPQPVVAPKPAPPPPDSDATAVFVDPDAHSELTTASTPAGAAVVEATEFSEDESPAPRVKPFAIPDRFGGFEIVQQLGQGGMGTVYLARQVSLDRPVALKVMNPQWTSDAAFVARFTREAYAAAQLVHHNIVQIYDLGAEGELNYFSMEFVKGKTLSELVKEKGKLDPEEATGYILQAARGLKFAHDQGMVHRDIKPDNLMLNDQGVVKVADLGLVKTPSAVAADAVGTEAPPAARPGSHGSLSSLPSVTSVGVAMGTPAYMAPEQGRNAATVDGRADIYSLGCTFYVLLTGRPPFSGKTAIEVMLKHASEPVIRPEAIVKRVPRELSDILLRMMAKKPEDRYAGMGEVVAALQDFLGVQKAGPFTPKEEHASLLEQCVKQFNDAPAARLRRQVQLGFAGLILLLFVMSGLFRAPRLAVGCLGLGLMTTLCSFVVSGASTRSYLFLKVRELVFSNTLMDWLTWAAGLVVFLLLLWLLGLLWIWLGFSVLGIGLAAAYHFFVQRKAEEQRRDPLRKAEGLLKKLRLGGLEEDAVKQFVCKYSGERWEEFYEELFGYELLLQARQRWARGDAGKPRPHHAAWRDPLIGWIDARQRALKERREKKLLQEIEQKNLQAQGVAAKEARARAEQVADVMVAQAGELKDQAGREAFEEAPTAPKEGTPPVTARALLETPAGPKTLPPELKKQPLTLAGVLGMFFGARVRFLVGALLLVACFLWMNQNQLIPSAEEAQKAIENRDASGLSWNLSGTKPLELPLLPRSDLFNGFNAGFAGLLLVLSAFSRSGKILFFFLLAALVAFLGSAFGVPEFTGMAAQNVSLILGVALAEFGFFFHRRTR
jgi:serine/threonine protein kinase